MHIKQLLNGIDFLDLPYTPVNISWATQENI